MIDYAEKIKEIRTNFSLTQEAMGKSIDVSRHVISQIELGNNRPSLEIIRLIAKKYRIKYEFFFEESAQISKFVEVKLFPVHESSASMIEHLNLSTQLTEIASQNLTEKELEEILIKDSQALKLFNKMAGKKFLEFLEKEKRDKEKEADID